MVFIQLTFAMGSLCQALEFQNGDTTIPSRRHMFEPPIYSLFSNPTSSAPSTTWLRQRACTALKSQLRYCESAASDGAPLPRPLLEVGGTLQPL